MPFGDLLADQTTEQHGVAVADGKFGVELARQDDRRTVDAGFIELRGADFLADFDFNPSTGMNHRLDLEDDASATVLNRLQGTGTSGQQPQAPQPFGQQSQPGSGPQGEQPQPGRGPQGGGQSAPSGYGYQPSYGGDNSPTTMSPAPSISVSIEPK